MLKDTAVEIYLAQPKGCAYGILAGANRYYDLGLSDQALELFVGFRGGMGCGSTCGSLVGAIAVLNRVYAGKPELKDHTAAFVAAFREAMDCGTLDCTPIADRYKTPETKCSAAVAITADLLEQFLQEKGR